MGFGGQSLEVWLSRWFAMGNPLARHDLPGGQGDLSHRCLYWMIGMDECGANVEFGEAAERGVFLGISPKSSGEDTWEDISRQSKSWGCTARHPNLLGLYLLLLVISQGCGRGQPEAVADRFMDSYYAAANLGEALQVAEGLAAKKIQDQQNLLKGQSGAQTTQGRKVTYNRLEKATVDGKLFFRYEVRIDIQGGSTLTRRSLLAMGQGPNGWRVTNFSETD